MQGKYVLVFAMGIAAPACGGAESTTSEPIFGSLHAAVEVSEVDNDVTAILFTVVAADQGCDGEAITSELVPLEAEALSASLGGSGTHAFADGFFVLEPGDYRICATPLVGDASSPVCGSAEAQATVAPNETTELVLVSQCEAVDNGGLDVVVTLNDAPVVTDLTFTPSKFITVCESLTASATASDPNADELTYDWSIVSGPDGASLSGSGASATFAGAAGSYSLQLTVSDGYGGSGRLTFPVHVADSTCVVPDEVQALFTQNCGPCHISGRSGGLGLADAVSSYAGLVNQASSAAACVARVRVAPGDPAASYLIAKLRGAPDICGTPMPRNAPQLADADLAAIEAWITSLPH